MTSGLWGVPPMWFVTTSNFRSTNRDRVRIIPTQLHDGKKQIFVSEARFDFLPDRAVVTGEATLRCWLLADDFHHGFEDRTSDTPAHCPEPGGWVCRSGGGRSLASIILVFSPLFDNCFRLLSPFLLRQILRMPHPVATGEVNLPAPIPSSTAAPVELELEHAVAYSVVPNTLHFHPNGVNYVHTVSLSVLVVCPWQHTYLDPASCVGRQVGAAIVVNDLGDPNKQEFLRGHDEAITCLAMSKSGRLLASGQAGRNSDVCVWSFDSRKLLYR
jgi:hypothetical protein